MAAPTRLHRPCWKHCGQVKLPPGARSASERLHRFADVSSVEGYLEQLATRAAEAGGALVALMPRAPGAREQRWAQLLSPLPPATTPAAASAAAIGAPAMADELHAELAQLRSEVQELRARVERLEGGAV